MITEHRAELAELLRALAVPVHDTVPEQASAPCIVMQPADPFVAEPTDGEATLAEPYVIGFEAWLLVQLDDEHSNEQASRKLDNLLDLLLDAVRPTAWWVDSMGAPGGLLTTEWIAHGQRVTLQRRTTL